MSISLNDLSNKQQMIYDYMKELFKADFPNLDLSDTGIFMETFGLTHLKLMEPLIEFVDRVTLKQSIENAPLLTIDEMDSVTSRYYKQRQQGNKATGTATLIFRDIPQTNVLQILAGIVALSRQGYRFVSTATVNIDASQLGNYYDADTFRFRIPVDFVAQDVGSQYNIEIGELTQLAAPLLFLDSVTNETKFIGGTDQESNVDLATRIAKSANTATLGNVRGYKRFFLDNFSAIEDVLIAGYGHPLMQRDIIGTAPSDKFNQTVRDIHWGTKIDAYIRGSRLVNFSEFLSAVTIPNTTTVGVTLTMVPMFDITQVTLLSGDPTVNPASLIVTGYTVIQDENPETLGTLYETTQLIFTDTRVSAGTSLQVSYRYNGLIKDINDSLYTEDNRPPAADVLLKQARAQYIFGSIVMKQLGALRLRDSDKSTVRQRSADYINTLKMGEEVQYSDIVDAISNADPTNPILDYIHLPTHFISLANNNKFVHYCQSATTRALLDAAAAQKTFFSTMLTQYKSKITIYDFFDCLHLLIFDEGLDDAISGINAISSDWTNRLSRFLIARDMIAKSKAVTIASPAKNVINTNQYFQLGQVSVYEDKIYTQADWMNLITLFETLANITANTDHTNDIFSLTCFCIAIVYLSANAGQYTPTTLLPFYLYFHDLSRNTPIQDQFN
jgi:hypothetical protein